MKASTPSNGPRAAKRWEPEKSCSLPWTPTAYRPASIALSREPFRARRTFPIIASGGAGKPEHFTEVLTEGEADAALAASIFHYGTYTVNDLKESLDRAGIPVRKAQ